ncbi:hypothetical protein Pmani_038476 [Petrolisthes manimaculis]|uniref:Uncharacterized protein n=1 Tax=Petrolisthes manimaculis TaxID=1843537 RepID=A0AAE1TK80_9EUCA|nr:hypothetical protein Pmani_038476 [Petrolisthes manimaculis]
MMVVESSNVARMGQGRDMLWRIGMGNEVVRSEEERETWEENKNSETRRPEDETRRRRKEVGGEGSGLGGEGRGGGAGEREKETGGMEGVSKERPEDGEKRKRGGREEEGLEE